MKIDFFMLYFHKLCFQNVHILITMVVRNTQTKATARSYSMKFIHIDSYAYICTNVYGTYCLHISQKFLSLYFSASRCHPVSLVHMRQFSQTTYKHIYIRIRNIYRIIVVHRSHLNCLIAFLYIPVLPYVLKVHVCVCMYVCTICLYACLSIRCILPLDIHFIFLFNFMPLSVISELSKLWFLLAKYQLLRAWEGE